MLYGILSSRFRRKYLDSVMDVSYISAALFKSLHQYKNIRHELYRYAYVVEEHFFEGQ